MNLPVFVINLERARSHWETVASSASLHARDFTLHRIDAVDGRLSKPEDREGVDLPVFRRFNGRDMLPGEYGCYRSHLRALEAFLADGAPYGLILEDDVVFESDSAARIEAALSALPEFGVLKLVNHRTRMMIGLCETAQGDRIGRALHGPQGSAAAYLVTREGARRLLDRIATMIFPWDVALERFWDHGASVFTSERNVLGFSEHRQQSNIAAAGYDRIKYPALKRLGAAAIRTRDYVARVRGVLRRPAEMASSANGREDGQLALPGWAWTAAATLVLLFVSAVWLESDLYRFAGVALVAAALVHYFRKDLWSYRDRPLIGWVGMMCLAWAVYVGGRFAYSYLAFPEQGKGTSEGIYLFPLFYPTLGYALLLFVRRPFALATAFIAISAASLALGIEYQLGSSLRAVTLLHNNPIHASVAAGLIAICAVPFGLHAVRRPNLERRMRLLLAALATATFLVALLAIYTLQSKGVWLAMAVALPLLAATILLSEASRSARIIALASVLAALVGAAVYHDTLYRIAAPTVSTSLALAADIVTGDGIVASLEKAIADETTGHSERERMKLWTGVLHIWSKYPIFGAGISWLHEWKDRVYQETDYNLIHNGYLEIAVRYGAVGLAFYAFLLAWSLGRVWQAARAGLVGMAAFQAYLGTAAFFAATLLTNSNNRLATGETYMWFGTSFGFYCYFLLQRHGLTAPKTSI